ncbi:MAG: bifunctional nicotinamidase/pyrazinamidase [Rhabdochlamydiaceae bacterium]|jgi:nicotinamidase/pyrazinamidase
MKALLIIDMQNDFMPGGALAVPEGDMLIPIINELILDFPLVVASQDTHPPDHTSFAIWPVHCVKNTQGWQLAPSLQQEKIHATFRKGEDKNIDSYSAFFDNAHLKATGLGEFLKARGVRDLYLVGVAIEYCVLFSALDALELGFNVFVLVDGCAGIDLEVGDVQRALDQIKCHGGKVLSLTDRSLIANSITKGSF